MALGTSINDSAHSGFANAANNLQTRLNTLYGSQAVWQPHFQSMFDRWSSISGLNYRFEAADDGAAITTGVFPTGVTGVRADVRIGGKTLDGNNGVLAYNYFPNIAEMVIDTNDTFYNDLSNNSLKLRNVLAHEHGHGVGMDHVDPTVGNFLMEPFLNTGFDGPQYHDILIAHRGYGDVNEKSFAGLGNDVSTRATSFGAIANNQTVSVGNDAANLPVAFNEVDFVSIDDTSDQDFYSFTVANGGAVSVFLDSLGMTYTVGPQGGPTAPFNTDQRSDLSLALIGTNGSTVLQSANATGLGGAENILFNLSGAGTYFVRINGVDNADASQIDTQFYRLSISMVPEPATYGLLSVLGVGALIYSRRKSLRKMVAA